MALRRVLHDPEPELRVMSEPINPKDIGTDEMNKLVKDMKDTMKKENGVGIAAPQLGIHKRVIIVLENDTTPIAYFNPEITERSFKKVESEEGCLSVPGTWGIVKRHRSVTLKAIREDGEKVNVKLTDFPAIVFQHEIDHLDGILFIDRVERMLTGSDSRI